MGGKYLNLSLVCGFNPSEKYARQIGSFPQGVKLVVKLWGLNFYTLWRGLFFAKKKGTKTVHHTEHDGFLQGIIMFHTFMNLSTRSI